MGGGHVPASSRMRGVVVRQSDQTGTPVGDRPNQIAAKVIVDPDVPGGGFEVDMSKISKQAMAEACEGAGMHQAMADQHRQEAAAMAMSNFANVPVYSQRPAPVQPAVAAPQPSGYGLETTQSVQDVPQPQVQPQVQPPAPQPTMPAADFGKQATAHPGLPATAPVTQPVQPPAASQSPQGSLFSQVQQAVAPAVNGSSNAGSADSGPPRIMGAMEYEGQGMKTEAYFHLVVRHHHLLILAFDDRVQGYPKSLPRLSDKSLAVHITDPVEGPHPTIFITQSAGIEFPLLGHEVCVLLIQDEKPVA